MQQWLPKGGMLPFDTWASRHRWILKVLWAHALVLGVLSLVLGNGLVHSVIETSLVAAFGVAATMTQFNRRVSTLLAAFGLFTGSAVLVHLFDGRIEMHFSYFVMVGIVTLYQDWLPLLASIGYVVLQHGIGGVVNSSLVYDHSSAIEHPWRWAAVHGGFILAMSAVGLVSWRMNETFQAQLTERENHLADTLSQLNATLDSTADGILVVSFAGLVTNFNEQFASLFEFGDDVRTPMDRGELLSIILPLLKEPDVFVRNVAEALKDPSGRANEVIELVDGRIFDCYYIPQVVRGEVVGRVWSVRDITERTQLEHALTHQAFHDSLTNLANKALFRDRVSHALDRAARDTGRVAVMFIDLDGFKTINDGLGHTVGDELLAAVAERFRGCLAPGDTAARLGGDEFAFLIEDVENEDCLARTAERLLDELKPPFQIGAREVYVRASLGLARACPGDTYDQLLRNADLAMYAAKRRGKNRFEVYTPGGHADPLAKLDLETAMRRGLDAEEFSVHYQPVVDLATGRIVGAEALARWRSPQHGSIPPATFIPVAEDIGLISKLGERVLRTACVQVVGWQIDDLVPADFSISVNLSTRQLDDDDLVSRVASILHESGLAAENLVLEITESAVMSDNDANVQTLVDLRTLGVRIAIDDFGTGYSSLSYLQRFPVDILKIDRSFVATIQAGGSSTSLAPAIVSLADSLSLRVVAEGVETELQADTLTSLGCQLAQGFYFAHPSDSRAMRQILEANPRHTQPMVSASAQLTAP